MDSEKLAMTVSISEDVVVDQADPSQLFGIYADGLVQKAHPLLKAFSATLSLLELKILDIYLSRINSKCSFARIVVFTKEELEQHLGVKKIRHSDIKEALAGLRRAEIRPKDTLKDPKGEDVILLFDRTVYSRNSHGKWYIILRCSEDAMLYIFGLDEENEGKDRVQYHKYYLAQVERLKSIYSYRMLMYLAEKDFRGVWSEDVDVLREYLNCTGKVYEQFPEFNRKILKACQEELEEKADVVYDYEVVKAWKTAKEIRFLVHKPVSAFLRGTAIGELSDNVSPEDEALDVMTGANSAGVLKAERQYSEDEIQEAYEAIGCHVSKDDIPKVFDHVDGWNHTAYRNDDQELSIRDARTRFLAMASWYHKRVKQQNKGSDGMFVLKDFLRSIDLYRGKEGQYGFLSLDVQKLKEIPYPSSIDE